MPTCLYMYRPLVYTCANFWGLYMCRHSPFPVWKSLYLYRHDRHSPTGKVYTSINSPSRRCDFPVREQSPGHDGAPIPAAVDSICPLPPASLTLKEISPQSYALTRLCLLFDQFGRHQDRSVALGGQPTKNQGANQASARTKKKQRA